MYVIVIKDNILLVYVEAHMTRTSKKDEFITRRKQYVVLGRDEVSALMASLYTYLYTEAVHVIIRVVEYKQQQQLTQQQQEQSHTLLFKHNYVNRQSTHLLH